MSNEDYSRVVSAFLLAYTIMNGALGADDRPPGDAPGLRAVRGVVGIGGGVLHAFARGTGVSASFVFCWASARRATGRAP